VLPRIFFSKIQSPDHCLHSVLPEEKTSSLVLRPRGHQFQLPMFIYRLFKRSFVNHCIFKFVCLVQLCFMHLRLFYAIKTYLLTYFGAKFGDEGVDWCKPNFNTIWSYRIQKKSCQYLRPFEHNAWTWQTNRETNKQIDIQTDKPRNVNIDRNKRNRLSTMSPKTTSSATHGNELYLTFVNKRSIISLQ